MMRTVLLQTDIVWGDPEANLKAAESLLASNAGADVYVFPEMFTTGFATQEGARIDEDPGRTMDWMKARAVEYDAAIAGSVAMRAGEKLVNRFCFVTPDGQVAVYDKRHLFTYGGEPDRFSAGDSRVVVEFRGVRFLLLVCYDLRFPVWSRNRDDYDAIIIVANWPVVRQDAWETLLKARSIENQCYVVGVNRAGKDPVCDYLGGSMLLNPYGQVVARCADNMQGTASGEIDMNLLGGFRKKFPVLGDADKFQLI